MQLTHKFSRSIFSLQAGLMTLALFMFQCSSDDETSALVADFTADVTTIPTGGVVTFTDQTIGVPDLRTWTFPGGTPSTFNGTEAKITYSAPGVYDVILTVLNARNTSTETKEGYITVTFVADFSADKTVIEPGETVFFTDLTNGSPNSWNWSFTGGDPAASDQQDVSVTYASAGVYYVTLEASDGNNTATETKTGYITVE